ncbi:uncharacterized protein [Palaemon carinicauda]|uniref:uncharacterized protein n=1 Tax=Palaemon carinicauda TaxID=392227 RepID=UPI0035B5C8D5
MEAVIDEPMAARAYPVGHAQIHRPNSARNRQGLLQRGRLQLKKRAPKSIRICTLNVGTMTGHGIEVADMMERRKVQILCFGGKAVTPQHRLLTVDWDRKRTIRGRQEMIPKIRWWKLKEPEYRDTFIERILVELGTWDYEDVDEWWERNSIILKRVGREVLGMSTGKGPRDKGTWWWSNYVQEKIKIKRNAKKTYDETGTEEDKERSKLAKKEAKVAVAQSNLQA